MTKLTGKYREFLAGKAPKSVADGVEPKTMPEHLFDYQAECTRFALMQGRAAMFLDTGMGKTRIQLEWCKQASMASNGVSLILTPLAVARQIEREAVSLGYDARVVRDASGVRPGINICNYDRLELLDAEAFGAVSLDESSILKSLHGSTRRALTEAFVNTRFRLCATATPAPNDHMELGNHAEFLGIMSGQEMLTRWFINDTASASQSWRLKGHARASFWDWVASWARCAETPADLGYDASRFVLPPMQITRHKVGGIIKADEGSLFAAELSATNMHAVKRQTTGSRAQMAAGLVVAEPNEPWLLWMDTDYEADAVCNVLPSSIDLRGSMSPEKKEAALDAFITQRGAILATKPGIAGAGLNFQHCARMIFVGRSFSYEAWYQAVRRCHRFGQTRPVHVHLIVAEGEDQIGRVIDAKSAGHSEMKREMAAAMKRQNETVSTVRAAYRPGKMFGIPAWLV
jgi:hypothetical protein